LEIKRDWTGGFSDEELAELYEAKGRMPMTRSVRQRLVQAIKELRNENSQLRQELEILRRRLNSGT
jgi:hypothetical protein